MPRNPTARRAALARVAGRSRRGNGTGTGTLWGRGRPAAPEEPTLAMDTHAAIQPVKPRLRGRLHQIAFFVVVPAGVALVAAAPTTRSRVATLVYALSLAGLYGTSAAY